MVKKQKNIRTLINEFILTKNEVIKLRELYSTGNYNYKEIGTMFNITPSYASQVIRKIKWKTIYFSILFY